MDLSNYGLDDISKDLELGYELLKKPFKNEFEQRAAKSFKATLIAAVITTLISIALFIIALNFAVPFKGPKYSARRQGTVEGDKVRYVQNTMKYLTLEELNIDPESVDDGDKIELYFNKGDSLIGAKASKKDDDLNKKYFMIFLGLGILVLILYMIIWPLTFGKPIRQYYKLRKSQRYNY